MSSRHPRAFEGSESPTPSIRAIQEAANEASRYPLNVEAYAHIIHDHADGLAFGRSTAPQTGGVPMEETSKGEWT